MGLFRKDDRHAVVDRLYQFVRRGGDDRARREPLSAWRFPGIVQSGKAKGPFRLAADEHGNLGGPLLVPFVKAIRHDQTALFLERALEGRFLGHAFSAGINHLGADAHFLGPHRDQPPAHRFEYILSIALNDRHHGLGGGNVVARLNRSVDLVKFKCLANFVGVRLENESSAHTASYRFFTSAEGILTFGEVAVNGSRVVPQMMIEHYGDAF